MTTAAYLRDIAARQTAQRQYASQHDVLAVAGPELARQKAAAGKPIPAVIVGIAADLAGRAWEAEVADREPRDQPWCDCIRCSLYVGDAR